MDSIRWNPMSRISSDRMEQDGSVHLQSKYRNMDTEMWIQKNGYRKIRNIINTVRNMSFLYTDDDGISPWIKDRRKFHPEQWWTDILEVLKKSSTVYVGNLSFYSTEEQVYQLFSQCGDIKRVIMGLNKHLNTPCGFCFVEYAIH